MEYVFTVCKILEGAIENNEKKYRSYAELLAKHLEEDGEIIEANMIRRRLDGKYKNSPKICLD